VSRNGTLLPIPEGSDLDGFIQERIDAWPNPIWPYRSRWLAEIERALEIVYPQSSSADRKLTARHYAPFPLRDGHDVP